MLTGWWAAGLSFSRGHKVYQVPNDCCLPMSFNGEEFSMAFRHWTWGYDHYTFRSNLVFHPYSRPKKPPLFWENEHRDGHQDDANRAALRLQQLFGMRITHPNLDYDMTAMEKCVIAQLFVAAAAQMKTPRKWWTESRTTRRIHTFHCVANAAPSPAAQVRGGKGTTARAVSRAVGDQL